MNEYVLRFTVVAGVLQSSEAAEGHMPSLTFDGLVMAPKGRGPNHPLCGRFAFAVVVPNWSRSRLLLFAGATSLEHVVVYPWDGLRLKVAHKTQSLHRVSHMVLESFAWFQFHLVLGSGPEKFEENLSQPTGGSSFRMSCRESDGSPLDVLMFLV